MPSLSIKKINKSYPKFELKDISFDIEEGSICGFIGRNGAGKTTTLKGIMGLIHLDSGSIEVFGRDFYSDEFANRQDIAFSLSEINFYPDAKIGNLTDVTKRFYKNWDDDKYQKLCKKFNLDQSKKVKELSSGMKVKYNLAIALSHDAKLLIFDEPTSGLDPVSRDEILDIFESLVKNKNRSILFSTHITSDLDKCADHIVYIKNGRIISSKTKNDFINTYTYIEGPKDDFDKIKEICISYKDSGIKITALIYRDDENKVPSSYSKKVPDLDTIMVYEERKDGSDEEFDL